MENVKYVLIVSQFYYSHHCFAVSAEKENFHEKALTLIEKLEDYKRSGEKREYSYGSYGNDREKAYTDINYRWNVNDSGDIYFIPCESIGNIIKQAKEYDTDHILTFRFKGITAKQRRVIESEIAEHHDYSTIKSIVSSVFNIL